MPLKLDTQKSIITDIFDGVKINKTVNDNDNLILTIIYTRLLGSDVVSTNNKHYIQGQDFLDIVMGVPDSGITRYADTKIALYGKLMSDLGLTGSII